MDLGINYQTDLHVPSSRTTIDKDFFNRRFKKMYDAVQKLNTAMTSFGAAEATLVQIGLERINETLSPLLVTLQEAADLGFQTAKSIGDAHSLVFGEAIGWQLTEGVELFAPTPYLLAQDQDDDTNWGILSLDEGGFTRSTGELATHVVYASQTLSSLNWVISCNSAVIPVAVAAMNDAIAAKDDAEAALASIEADMVTIQALLEAIGEGPVASVNGQTGIVSLGTSDIVGLTTALAGKVSTSQLAAKQDASAKLTALVNLTWAANAIIYATGAGTLATLPITTFMKELLNDDTAAAARTSLELGTAATAAASAFQTANAKLSALAALTLAADRLVYATGADTFDVTTFTAAARSLLAAADVAAMRTALELGTAAQSAATAFQAADPQLFSNIPQNLRNAAYTLTATDAQKHLYHTDGTGRTWTIPSNANVPFPIGTAVQFINGHGAANVTIAIQSDTMRLAGAGTTGSRTLAANGMATAIKVNTTEWKISGTGLT